ncbi:serine protease [Spongiactinospora gelatinilytica]|uniref:Serine protease n=1 Tax=Spongiactinospora gelatinilytica TaxID=2666298 RepID=A0A2W2GUR3_9ACTN|nr:serine protease [Spongiactinospora gelatinilytica]PZG51423.1 serine protease [Spongiactinospora gelatinilytica]
MRRLGLFLAFCISTVGLVLAGPPAAQAIVGGANAPAPYSFMVSLQSVQDGEYKHFCGGGLIAPSWVVTASHCIDGDQPADLRLRIGGLRWASGGTVRAVTEIVPHPDGTAVRDIALLKLDRPVSGTPIRIGASPAEGDPTRLIGWGCTNQGPFLCTADVLQQLDSAIRPASVCDNSGGPVKPGWELCTGNPDDVAGPCKGDSGGPLLVPSGGTWKLVGVFNRMSALCEVGAGIYADAAAHRPWIESVTGPLP